MNYAYHMPAQSPLAIEAMNLHNALSETYWREFMHRDSFGRNIANPERLARIESIQRRAADRWRRRMGYQPIYN